MLSMTMSAVLMAATQSPSACATYSGATEVSGVISFSKSSGPPGHKALDDPIYDFLILHLDSPICVLEGQNSDGLEPALTRIEHIELSVVDSSSYRALRPLVGRSVVCHGRVVAPVSGFHWSHAILIAPRCSTSGA